MLRGNGWHCNSAITPPEWWLPPSDSISLITLNSKWIVSLSSAAAAQRNCWDIKSSHYLEAEDARSRSSCLYVNGGSSRVTYLTFDGKLSSRARILLESARVCWYQRCEIQMALLERECLVWRKDSGPRRTSSEDYFRWWQFITSSRQLRPRISASVTSWVVFPLFPLYNKEAALMMESFCVRLTKKRQHLVFVIFWCCVPVRLGGWKLEIVTRKFHLDAEFVRSTVYLWLFMKDSEH